MITIRRDWCAPTATVRTPQFRSIRSTTRCRRPIATPGWIRCTREVRQRLQASAYRRLRNYRLACGHHAEFQQREFAGGWHVHSRQFNFHLHLRHRHRPIAISRRRRSRQRICDHKVVFDTLSFGQRNGTPPHVQGGLIDGVKYLCICGTVVGNLHITDVYSEVFARWA